jgi:hypothetical protein
MTSYADPSTPTGVDLKTLKGALLLIEPLEVVQGMQTSFGPADPIRCNVAVLDGETKGAVHNDTLIFPKVLISQLRTHIGGKVLARLGQGQAKPGQSAPWMLYAANDDDKATAAKYEAYVASQQQVTVDPF